jgi:hypothetical protein
MGVVVLVLSWLFSILFGLSAISMLLMGNLLQAIPHSLARKSPIGLCYHNSVVEGGSE